MVSRAALKAHIYHPGRGPSFEASIYARRNAIKRCVGRLKQWRGSPPLRQTGVQLPGGGGHRGADDLADLMNHQIHPRSRR